MFVTQAGIEETRKSPLLKVSRPALRAIRQKDYALGV